MGNNGTATFVDAYGQSHVITPTTPLDQVYALPGVKEAWDAKYGGSETPNTSSSQEPFFNIPTDIMPTSRSGSSSYSGLPSSYQNQLLSGLMPQLQSAITNMPGNIDQYTNEALGGYQQMMQNALRKNIPAALGGLANRGILSSTEGNKVLSDVISNAATDASTKGYNAAMQAALLKAGMPATLAQIATLGNSSQNQSSSYSEDPTVMYKTMASLIQSMMG
jgi:hypothetical protein